MTALEPLAEAERLLAEIVTVDEAIRLRDLSEAARVYARQMGHGLHLVNYATGVKLRAEMRMAQLVDKGQEDGDVATPGGDPNVRNPHIALLSDLGVSRFRLREARLLLAAYTPEQVIAMVLTATKQKRELARHAMVKKAFRASKEQERDRTPPASDVEGDGWRVFTGDFRDRLAHLDGEVDLVVTDPPYDDDSLPLYGDLAEWAARAVRAGGVVAVYTGNHRLPEVLNLMRAHLEYRWLFAVDLRAGANARFRNANVMQSFKPLPVFCVGSWVPAPWGPDVLVSDGPSKDRHRWQQNATPVRQLIERFSGSGWVVADPFLGAGTTGYAALGLGRQFIGCDIDPACTAGFRP